MNGFKSKSLVMTALRIVTFFGLILAAPSGFSFTPNHLMGVRIESLHPTQLNVGMLQVLLKTQKLASLDSEALETYLQENPVPVVVGPGGKYYLTDRHHLTRALFEVGVGYVYVQVIRQAQDLNENDFWKMMEAEGLCYLKDVTGRPISHHQLFDRIDLMGDDPYRSLAAAVQKAGGYNKGGFFTEFAWARFFRRLNLTFENSEKGVAKVLKRAVAMAKSSMASSLPGFVGARSFTTCQRLLAN